MNELELKRKKWPVATVILAAAATLLALIAGVIHARIMRGYFGYSYAVIFAYGLMFYLVPPAAALVIYGAGHQEDRLACMTAAIWFGLWVVQIIINGFVLHFGNVQNVSVLFRFFVGLAIALLYLFHVLKPNKGLVIGQLICSIVLALFQLVFLRSVRDLLDIFADWLLMSALLVAAFALLPKKERAAVPAPGAYAYAPAGQPVYQPAPVMFCPNCGRQFPSNMKFCNQCGTPLREAAVPAEPVQRYAVAPGTPRPEDAPSTGFAVLGFFLPAVGLILYLVWKDELPQRAKSAGKGALIGVIVAVGLSVLISIAYLIFAASIFSNIFW